MINAATSVGPVPAAPATPWLHSARKYLASAAWRFGGAGIGAMGAIVAARRLGPEKLGVSGVAQAVLLGATLFVILGQDISLVRNYRNEAVRERRNELVNQVFWGRIVLSVLLGSLMALAGALLGGGHRFLLASAAAGCLLVLQTTSPTWIFQATDDVPAQQRFLALQACLTTGLTLLLLLPYPLAGIDLVAQALATAVAWIFQWRYARREHPFSAFAHRHWQDYIVRSFRHNWLFLSAVVIYLYVNFQPLLVAGLCSVTELGLYRPALQVVQAIYPFLALIPAILYPRLIDWAREGPTVLFRRQLQLLLGFSLALVPASALAFLLLPRLFPLVFGAAFTGGALPCAMLLTAKGVVVLNSLFTWGLWAQQRDKAMLAVTGIVAAISLGLDWFLIPHGGALAASGIACVSEAGVLLGSMYLSWRNLPTTRPA